MVRAFGILQILLEESLNAFQRQAESPKGRKKWLCVAIFSNSATRYSASPRRAISSSRIRRSCSNRTGRADTRLLRKCVAEPVTWLRTAGYRNLTNVVVRFRTEYSLNPILLPWPFPDSGGWDASNRRDATHNGFAIALFWRPSHCFPNTPAR